MEQKASFSKASTASRWRIKTTTARRHCLYNPIHIDIMTMMMREKKNLFHTGVLVVYRKTLGLFWVRVSLFWRVGHSIQKHLGRRCCSNHMTAYLTSLLWNGCGIQNVFILVTLGIGCWDKQLLQSWPYFVYWICWICFCLLFAYFFLFLFFFLHSGFKYFFIQRKKKSLCSWKKKKKKNSKTAQTISFRYFEMHECDCWCFKEVSSPEYLELVYRFWFCFRDV